MADAVDTLPALIDSSTPLVPRAECGRPWRSMLPEVDQLGDEDLRQAAHGASIALVQGRVFLGRCLQEIHERELWYQWGYSGLNHFVRLALKMEVREAKECRRVARALERLPQIAEAAEAGLIGWGNLREVVRVATPEDEGYWLRAACTRVYDKLCAMIRRFKEGGDPDEVLDERGCVATRIVLDLLPEEAELSQAATAVLSAQAGQLLSPREAYVDLCRQVVEGRLRTTPAQIEKTHALIEDLQALRRSQADADMEAVAHEAGVPVPELEGHARVPTVQHSWADHRRALWDCSPDSTPGGPGTGSLGGASVAWERSLDPWRVASQAPAVPWAAAAVEERPIPENPHLAIAYPSARTRWTGPLSEAERHARFPTEAVRRWVYRRDGFKCRCPGCPNMVWLRTHHLVFYCRGGLTVPPNLVICCSACHRNIHKRRLFVAGDGEKTLTWTDRRGRILGDWTADETERASTRAASFMAGFLPD